MAELPRAEQSEVGNPVFVAVPGFAEVYAAALKLPLSQLQNDPSWCLEQLEFTELDVTAE